MISKHSASLRSPADICSLYLANRPIRFRSFLDFPNQNLNVNLSLFKKGGLQHYRSHSFLLSPRHSASLEVSCTSFGVFCIQTWLFVSDGSGNPKRASPTISSSSSAQESSGGLRSRLAYISTCSTLSRTFESSRRPICQVGLGNISPHFLHGSLINLYIYAFHFQISHIYTHFFVLTAKPSLQNASKRKGKVNDLRESLSCHSSSSSDNPPSVTLRKVVCILRKWSLHV
jgi:hypothetical protein